MKTRALVMVAATWVLLFSTGCLWLIQPSQTTVHLVNNTNFPVDVRLFYDDDQYLTEDLLELDGTEVSVTVESGQTYTFTRDCEALQAIFITDADMRVAPGISPEADTRVYREPGDFGCGDTLTFTFTQDVLGLQLSISFAQQN